MTRQDGTLTSLWRHTNARVGIGRAGDGLPTKALLEFQMAHAKARDAVHRALDVEALRAQLAPRQVLWVPSAASDRGTYLRRPDLGRRVAPGEFDRLGHGPFEVVIIIADGLSSTAVDAHAAIMVAEIEARLAGIHIGPIVIATQARVAIGDDIGAQLNAALTINLIGERPGLSSPDSLGAYLTFNPRPGVRDNARNCVSNIHRNGLSYSAAAGRIAWLVREALRLKLTGVDLKEAAPIDVQLALPAPRQRIVADSGIIVELFP